MATLLADPPAVAPEQAPAPGSPGASAAPEVPPPGARQCPNCAAPMAPAQDWCLQCGAASPSALASGASGWRSAAILVGATAILAAGAAAAAYAALSKPAKPRHVVAVVQSPGSPTTTAPAAPPAAPTTSAPKAPGTPTTVKPAAPSARAKPPKIPLTAATPKAPVTTPAATTPSGAASTPSTTPTESSGSASTPGASAPPPQPSAIQLDTNAAVTYNPDHYPASEFGDPSLAIDGDTSTAWTARVNPTTAPKMAAGLAIDLKGAQRLSAVELVTSTPGMTVQVYGASGSALPASITDKAWVALSPSQVVKNRHARIKLRDSTQAFRFVTLWISRAPAASVGTPQAPGYVRVNEIELFPAK